MTQWTPELRDAKFIQSLKPIPEWLPRSAIVTAEEWLGNGGRGWNIDGCAYWAVGDFQGRGFSAWSERPKSATHVAIYYK